jgi:hypothetical protein
LRDATRSENQGIQELVYGSGEMAQEERPLSGFDRVALGGVGKLVISQGEREQLVISAEENLLPYITTQVRGSELVIGMQRGKLIVPSHTLEYRLTVKDLRAVKLAGWGDVEIRPLEVGELEVTTAGAGRIALLDVQAEELCVLVNGSGSVSAKGKVTFLALTINGAGSFLGESLQSQEADLRIAGFGNAVAWVRRALETRISGFGTVSYYGSPQVQQRNYGVGIVRRLGDR